MQSLPKCDFCDKEASYDCATSFGGSWAYCCEAHYQAYRLHATLGTGKGQRLVLAMK